MESAGDWGTADQKRQTVQESWKLPRLEFIGELYFKHFKKGLPENVRSIEQMVHDFNRKQAERRTQKQA